MKEASLMSKADATVVLKRTGHSDHLIKQILDQVPDPIDTVRDQDLLASYDVTLEQLADRIGGSP